jgi:predicted phosphodiesterase
MDKIQFVSDLHLEFRRNEKASNLITPVAPILALLGDSCCLALDEDFVLFARFIEEVKPKFKAILIVPGNHEYYYTPDKRIKPTFGNTVQGTQRRLQNFCDKDPKLHYFERRSLTLKVDGNKFVILGTTLWTRIPKSREKELRSLMNDYNHIYVAAVRNGEKIIRKLLPADVNRFHTMSKNFLEKEIEKAYKSNARVIILSHHMPYIKDEKNHHPGYSSDMDSILKPNVIAWLYGHTHEEDRTKRKGVLYLSNPKGYQYQRTNFKQDKTISLKIRKKK